MIIQPETKLVLNLTVKLLREAEQQTQVQERHPTISKAVQAKPDYFSAKTSILNDLFPQKRISENEHKKLTTDRELELGERLSWILPTTDNFWHNQGLKSISLVLK